MTLLADIYASGGDEIIIPTLSFRCSAWASPVHLARSIDPITATLETGEAVTFLAGDFADQLVKQASEGQQAAQFVIAAYPDPAIDNDIEPLALLDAARDAGAKVYVDYREFILGDLSAPARPVETLTVTGYTVQDDQLAFTASFYDLVNKAYPRRRYTARLFPGLKYV